MTLASLAHEPGLAGDLATPLAAGIVIARDPSPHQPIVLSLVIPAHNEELRLPASLVAARDDLDRRSEPCEIIVVDDGSSDRTAEIAMRHGARVVRLPTNLGKGAAVRAGVRAARGEYILISDADLSTPLVEYDALRRAVDGGAAVAIGSRAVPGARITEAQPFHRRAMGRVFNRMVQVLVLPGVRDTQCGFKLFRAAAAQAAFARSRVDGFAFDVEVLAIVRAAGGAIAEVPVEWHDGPRSTVRPFRDVPRMVLELMMIRYHNGRAAVPYPP